MSGIGYRPEIDGLRAVAVIPVILFHAGVSWLPGGFIGVDVFFVISGFLITSIIKKDLDRGTFSFREFWVRRIRRIVPALTFVTAATLVVTYFFVFGPDQQAIGKQALASMLSMANIYFWSSTGDYWGTAAEESPFLHAWSLSVEEQFYLFFPIAMWAVFRYRPRWINACILLAVAVSLALFFWGFHAHPVATFYLLPTRIWELGAGCLLAVSLQNQTRKLSGLSLFADAGLCMILTSYLLVDRPSGGVCLAVVGTVLIIAFGQSGKCNKLLTQIPVVHIGVISYSLYLWHWPILVLAKQFGFESSGFSDEAMLMSVIYVCALGTYYCVETVTRHRSGILPGILGCAALVIASSVFIGVVPKVYDTSEYETPHWYGLYYDLTPGNQLGGEWQRIIGTMNVPRREALQDAFRKGGIIVGEDDSSPRIVVLGDSHGVMWSDAIRTVAENLKVKASFISMNGVTPFFSLPLSRQEDGPFLSSEERFAYDQSRMEFLRAWKPDLVILCCRWSTVAEESTKDLLEFLELHSAEVLLMEQPPVVRDVGNRNLLQYIAFRGIRPELGKRRYYPAGDLEQVEEGRELVRRLSARYRNCSCIGVHDLYREGSDVLVLDGKNCVYVDDDHLTTFGARLAVPLIAECVKEVFQ